MRTVLHGRHRLTKLLVVGGAVAIGAVAVPAAYAATTPPTGFVKICKVAGPGVAKGQVFKFTVGSAAISVAAGSCGAPITLPAGNVTVKETATAGLAVSAIAVTGVGTLVSSDTAGGTAVVKVASGAT